MAFAHLLHVVLLQHSSFLGLDDSVASLRSCRPCAPAHEGLVAVPKAARQFRGYILLGLGLDLLLDDTLNHGFIVRGGSLFG